ncbi:putative flippase GtrA [Rhizobium skierniewicense]|uniref:Putative flippase GtrA n=1 Tax=Rhizobium skierniewicense TaxID=984260 RepID=A0A7W6C7G7_9HYPH|nr:GtrA family protein [Rhizobium skierniewicense]MBB3944597.1 putative flippase GtrA [Rhizobium skierniewicense]
MIQFLLYCVCGGIGVSTDYLVYYLSIQSGLWYQSANVLGYLCGTIISFFLNRIITFKARDKIAQRFAIFLSVAAVGFTASVVMLWVLVDYMSVDEKIAKLLTLPVVVVIQFILNRRITFGSTANSR